MLIALKLSDSAHHMSSYIIESKKKTLLVWHIVKRDLRTDSVGNISLKAPRARVGIAMTNPEHRLTDWWWRWEMIGASRASNDVCVFDDECTNNSLNKFQSQLINCTPIKPSLANGRQQREIRNVARLPVCVNLERKLSMAYVSLAEPRRLIFFNVLRGVALIPMLI